jgi:hypothetical protein
MNYFMVTSTFGFFFEANIAEHDDLNCLFLTLK